MNLTQKIPLRLLNKLISAWTLRVIQVKRLSEKRKIQRVMDFENALLGIHQDYLNKSILEAEYCAALLLTRNLRLQKKPLFPKLETQSVTIQHLNTYHWVGLSDRIRRSLIQWHLGHYPLILCFYVPTPYEILEIQARGQRVVTAFNTVEDWNKNWGHHDAWNFIAHDLIHADHFFINPENRNGQIQFYKTILKNWKEPEIRDLQSNPDFEYLISDMNSHPMHMIETLKSLLIRSIKKRNQISDPMRLPNELETQVQGFMLKFKNAMETF